MPVQTVAELLLARADDDHPALLFEDSRWTWREQVAASAARAALLRPGQHVGVLLDNTPEYLFLLGGAALAGATVVGINPTRRGAELAADIRATDCAVICTDTEHSRLLDGLDLGEVELRLVDTPGYADALADVALVGVAAEAREQALDPAHPLLLLFTSGSTGAPKAVRCSTGRFATIAQAGVMPVGRDDVAYNAMPLFHGNALMASWAPCLGLGATFALRRRFSASGFLPDVQRFGATFFNYVGRSLAYVLAQPETADEQQSSLRFGFGTEASAHDRAEFERRFGCSLFESYGSSEGTLSIRRTPETPAGALGLPAEGQEVAIVDPDTGAECPRAQFDADGRLLNTAAATGEIVARGGAARFEGYYANPAAEAERVRGADFHTGDLGFRDAEGFFHFAGRSTDWLRVDSENFGAAPVERILARFPGCVLAVVYPVPDPQTGDQVMASLQLRPGSSFDGAAFARFLAAQPDLGTKWAPRFVRIVETVPQTATRKVDKPALRRELWDEGEVYLAGGDGYRTLTVGDRDALVAAFTRHGRTHLLT